MRTGHNVTTCIAKGVGSWFGENGRIKPACCCSIGNVRIPGDIGTLADRSRTNIGNVSRDADTDRSPAACRDDPVHLPSTQNRVANATQVGQIGSALSKRQFVNVVQRKDVSMIKDRKGPFQFEVVWVLSSVAQSEPVAIP